MRWAEGPAYAPAPRVPLFRADAAGRQPASSLWASCDSRRYLHGRSADQRSVDLRAQRCDLGDGRADVGVAGGVELGDELGHVELVGGESGERRGCSLPLQLVELLTKSGGRGGARTGEPRRRNLPIQINGAGN